MPDQLTLLSVDAWGNEEDGWQTYWLTPTGLTFELNKPIAYYHKQIRKQYPNLPHFQIIWDDDQFGQIIRHKDGKPLFELVPELTE